MKIHKKTYDTSSKSHIISLTPEKSDDIYTLYNIIDASDQIESFSSRKVEVRPGVKTRIVMKLCIRIESINADLEACVLHAKGRVMNSNEHVTTGSYHTLEVGLNQFVTIYKSCWSQLAEKSLKTTVDKKDLLFVIIKQKEFIFCVATENAIEPKSRVDYKSKNYKPVLAKLTPASMDEYRLVVIASCYDARKDFKKTLIGSKDMKKFESRIVDVKIENDDMATTKLVGKILESNENQNTFSGIQFCEEIRMVNLFYRMHNDGELTCIGLEKIKESLEYGALKDFLITNTKFKSFDIEERKAIEKLCEDIKKRKISIHIIPAKHTQGEMLNEMGGIVGILKFNCFE